MQHVVQDRNSTLNEYMIASHTKITYKLGRNENQQSIITSANDQCEYVGIMHTFVLRPTDRTKYYFRRDGETKPSMKQFLFFVPSYSSKFAKYLNRNCFLSG